MCVILISTVHPSPIDPSLSPETPLSLSPIPTSLCHRTPTTLVMEGHRGCRHRLRHRSGCHRGRDGCRGSRRRLHRGSSCRRGRDDRRGGCHRLRHRSSCRWGRDGHWRGVGEVVAASIMNLASVGAISLHPLPSSSMGPNPTTVVEEAANLAAAGIPSLPPCVGLGGVPQGEATTTRQGDDGGAAPPGGTVTSLPPRVGAER
jgi:hypothetical protein